MITMSELKDIVLRAIPGKGYVMLPCTKKAEVVCLLGSTKHIDYDYLELAMEKMRELGLSFGFSR